MGGWSTHLRDFKAPSIREIRTISAKEAVSEG